MRAVRRRDDSDGLKDIIDEFNSIMADVEEDPEAGNNAKPARLSGLLVSEPSSAKKFGQSLVDADSLILDSRQESLISDSVSMSSYDPDHQSNATNLEDIKSPAENSDKNVRISIKSSSDGNNCNNPLMGADHSLPNKSTTAPIKGLLQL